MTATAQLALEARLEVLKLNELPAVPVVAQQIMHTISDPECQINTLAELIEQDPALLARVIGVANSAYFSPSTPILNAHDAIFKVLGLNTTKSLVLAIILSGPFDISRCPAFCPEDFWLESVFSATLAQTIAPLIQIEPKPDSGAPYLAALLLRIGVLAMVHVYPKEMGLILNEMRRQTLCKPEMLFELERDRLGVTHGEVGAWLGRRWHLPAMIIEVIEQQFDPERRGQHWPLAMLVGFCARWAATAVRGGGDEEYPSLTELTPLGVDIAQAGNKLGTVALKLDELRALAQRFADSAHG